MLSGTYEQFRAQTAILAKYDAGDLQIARVARAKVSPEGHEDSCCVTTVILKSVPVKLTFRCSAMVM